MKNFNRDNRSSRSRGGKDSGRRDFGGGGQRFGGRDSSRSSMHQAICSDCGKVCEVPFRPTGDRPVFCSVCFEKHGKDSDRSGGKNYGRSDFADKKMFKAICDKCGRECEVPFRPTSGKPVYCNQCFDKGGSTGSKSPDQFKQQFEVLNSKLDRILKALTPVAFLETSKEVKPMKEKVEAKKSKGSKTATKAAPKKTKTKKKK